MPKGFKHSEETLAKMRIARAGAKPFLGKKHSEESKKKMAQFGKDNGFFDKKHSQETKNIISKSAKSRLGERAGHWKGDRVGRYGLHCWLKSTFGQADHCDLCGTTEQPKHSKRNNFEWSCMTGIYERKAENWWMLCAKCHRNYDRKLLVRGISYLKAKHE